MCGTYSDMIALLVADFLTSCVQYLAMPGTTRIKASSATCAKGFLVAIQFLDQAHPIMMEADGVGMSSAEDTFFSSSLASAALFVFRNEPSAFV